MLYPGPPSRSDMLIEVRASCVPSLVFLEHVLGDLAVVHLRLDFPGNELIDEGSRSLLERQLGSGQEMVIRD